MLEVFLSKLGASTRITVGVSVSPGLGLEMIEIDSASGTVNKYGFKPLEYNSSTREIEDYDQFRIALEELFEELHIPKRSNIVLSLPNVHFGLVNLPLLLTDDAITNAIISEVEQSYIFKRQEPVVGWTEINANIGSENRSLAYTAIQKEALEKITEVCDELGCTLTCIENSYCSLFRTLNFLGSAKDQFKENVSWNLMVIMQNNYSLLSMSGKNIIEYYEEPLALKSFVDDEIYNAIKSSAQLTLSGLPANYLFIISETDLVSAEVLSMKIATDSTVVFMECNKFVQEELVPVNLNVLPKVAAEITPEAIGTAVYQFCESPLKLNIAKELVSEFDQEDSQECPRINVGNLEVELTPDFIKKISLIIGAIIIIPVAILFFILNNIVLNKEQARLDSLNSKISTLNKDIDRYEDIDHENTFDLRTEIEKYTNQNKLKLAYYSALGMNVPNKLWITYSRLTGDGKIDLKGEAKDVNSVYAFYKSLKQSVINSDIRLHKLEIAGGTIDDIIAGGNSSKHYIFEITNMTAEELNPPAQPAAETQPATDGSQQATSNTPALSPSSAFSNFFPSAQQNPPLPPTQGAQPPQPDGEKLPDNLKKIEKF